MDKPLVDEFRGNDAHLVECIKALISLSDDGALVPHGLGGHARALLSAAATRLESAKGEVQGVGGFLALATYPYVQRILAAVKAQDCSDPLAQILLDYGNAVRAAGLASSTPPESGAVAEVVNGWAGPHRMVDWLIKDANNLPVGTPLYLHPGVAGVSEAMVEAGCRAEWQPNLWDLANYYSEESKARKRARMRLALTAALSAKESPK